MSAPLSTEAKKELRPLLEQLRQECDGRPERARELATALITDLSTEDLGRFLYDWTGVWARPKQLLPAGDWYTWFICAGRNFGKTRTGAETVRHMAETKQARRIALIAPTSHDLRKTMIEGESGLLACSAPWFFPKYEPSKLQLTWPNGVQAFLYSAEEGERLRGPQHDFLWGDEPASWQDAENVWSNAVFGLRLGKNPRGLITGTPKPVPLVLQLLKDPDTHVTTGSTYENPHVARKALLQMERLYGGTRIGRQELLAEVLEDMPGALFSLVHIDRNRVAAIALELLERIVIAVDPAPTSDHGSDETGIVVVAKGLDGHGYLLEDLSGRYTPDEWARVVCRAFYRWKAELVVAETNNGGDLVAANVHTVDPNVPFQGVRAMRGKAKRAEPIAALYEQGRVHHVGKEQWQKLERQARVFTGVNGKRDDRIDAACWGLHFLLMGEEFAFV